MKSPLQSLLAGVARRILSVFAFAAFALGALSGCVTKTPLHSAAESGDAAEVKRAD